MSENNLNISVESMIPQITEQVAAELRKKAIESFGYEVQQAVTTEVRRYITENIVPTLTAELKEKEPEIRAAFVAGIVGTAHAVAEHARSRAVEKLAGYEGDKLIRSIFDSLFSRY